MQYDLNETCSALVSAGAAIFGIVYFVCRFKDVVVASYFVAVAGSALESTAIGLRDSELAYLIQFTLYVTSLGFHTEEARLLYSPDFDTHMV